ncbi:MAG: hypothetical protein AB7J46_06590 [Candidatus Altimarinota bacterium]
MAQYLDYFQIPYSSIWDQPGKPIADFYIDDRGLHFQNWQQVADEVEERGSYGR